MSATCTYRIGEVAAATGVTVETLRFYEREGLLPTSPRSAGGARRYAPEVIGRVTFIKQAQAVGLKLGDIQILLDSRQSRSPSGCQKVRTLLARRIEEIAQRVEEMQTFLDVLREHLQACDGALSGRTAQTCPTLDAIERRGESRLEHRR